MLVKKSTNHARDAIRSASVIFLLRAADVDGDFRWIFVGTGRVEGQS